MPSLRLLAAAAAFAVGAPVTAADAQRGWSILPDGHPAHADTYRTSGRFVCNGQPFDGACQVVGNTLRLGNNGAFLTLEFIGRSQALVATPGEQTTTLGTLVTTVSGTGPFAFPGMLLGFSFFLDVQNGAGVTDTRGFGYLSRMPSTELPVGCCDDYKTFVSFAVPRPPGNFTYSSVVFSHFPDLRLAAVNSSLDITVTYGLIPEPSAYALTLAGLVGVLGVAHRGRRTGRRERHRPA